MVLLHALQALQEVVHLVLDLRQLPLDGVEVIHLDCREGSGAEGGEGAPPRATPSTPRSPPHLPVREVLWTLLEDEEKLLLVRRLPPPLRLTRGRLEGMTARDRGGGGGGTRDW